jgi:polyhydroxyalkanoate synthesis regulator phasin
MAKKGKGKKKMEEQVIEEVIETPVEEITEETVQAVANAIVEEADEQNVEVKDVVDDIIEESKEQNVEIQEELPTIKEGIVGGCTKLNVRSEANTNSNVVCVLDADTKVIVYPDESNDDFYKIKTTDGLDGYCKADFIWINQEG